MPRRFHEHTGLDKGNVIFFILVAIVLLGALAFAVSKSTEQELLTDKVVIHDQVTRLFSQAGVLAGAVQQMVINGADPSALDTLIDAMKPDDADWDIAPHQYKIYHPYGGGVEFMDSTGRDSDDATIARNFEISPGSRVEGVGPTDTGGDILFTATVASAAACEAINERLRGRGAATPVLDTAQFNTLEAGTDTVITATECADCAGLAAACAARDSGDAWLFYKALAPK